MDSYLNLARRIIKDGKWVTNARTGKRCLTVINADFEFDVSEGVVPLVTTKRVLWKPAIAEILGYLRGYDNAQQFADIGAKTWFANANESPAWLANPNRKGQDDIGRAYGVQGRSWRRPDGSHFDQLAKVVDDLSKGYDDRREIVSFWNPGESHLMALAACMHTHTFSVLDGGLYLTSYQRSADVPLGLVWNHMQVAWLLMVMAQITGLKAKTAFHKVVNAHIYEDQIQPMVDVQLLREPNALPKMKINPDIKSLKDLETWVTTDDFEIEGYECWPPIAYPFSA